MDELFEFPNAITLDLGIAQREAMRELADALPHANDEALVERVLWRGIEAFQYEMLGSIRDALRASSTPEVVDLSAVLSLKLGPLVRELAERLDSFEAWKASLVMRDDILGGEPVFAGSRLAVRRVGALAERGESTESILADSPYLKAADVEFAKLYTKAYPRVGRPRGM